MLATARQGVSATDHAERMQIFSVREALRRAQGELRAGDLARAEQAFRRILDAEPGCPEAWFFLGVIAQRRKDFHEAVSHYRRAIEIDHGLAEAYNNLGVVLQDRGEIPEAEGRFREAIRLMPDYPEAHNNLGNALQDQGRYAEAVEAYRRSLSYKPDYLEARKHLGNALRALGRLDEAMACYEAGLRLAPDHILLHMARAMVWIQQGDYLRGWAECDWRLRGDDSPVPPFDGPTWDGAPLEGQSILVYAEQGLGDTIQFLRYLPLVAGRGGRVILACPTPLANLSRTCAGVTDVARIDLPLPKSDWYVPLLSLPRIFGTTLETIPSSFPYLSTDEARISRWRDELGPVEGIKVGVVWRGNPLHTKDRHRSFPLAGLEAVAQVPGIRLYSIQKNFGLAELEGFAKRFPITDLGPRIDDFLDTAAVMRNLDLVISADSSPAHLAGALGVPVWVALPYTADWRWMSGRCDSPWYPSLRLFRQHRFGEWDGVFADMAAELSRTLGDRR